MTDLLYRHRRSHLGYRLVGIGQHLCTLQELVVLEPLSGEDARSKLVLCTHAAFVLTFERVLSSEAVSTVETANASLPVE